MKGYYQNGYFKTYFDMSIGSAQNQDQLKIFVFGALKIYYETE